MTSRLRGRGIEVLGYCFDVDCARMLRSAGDSRMFPIVTAAEPSIARNLEALLRDGPIIVVEADGKVRRGIAMPARSDQNSREVQEWLNGL